MHFNFISAKLQYLAPVIQLSNKSTGSSGHFRSYYIYAWHCLL